MRTVVFATLLLILGCHTLSAQDGILVHGAVTTAINGGQVNAAASGGVGYEWGPLRVSGEVIRTSQLPANFVHIFGDEAWTRVTALMGSARIRMPLGQSRLSAFVLGGAGSARITDTYTVVYIAPGPNPINTTIHRAALTAGGGLRAFMSDRVSIEVEGRVLRIAGDRSRSIGLLGGGLSIRF